MVLDLFLCCSRNLCRLHDVTIASNKSTVAVSKIDGRITDCRTQLRVFTVPLSLKFKSQTKARLDSEALVTEREMTTNFLSV